MWRKFRDLAHPDFSLSGLPGRKPLNLYSSKFHVSCARTGTRKRAGILLLLCFGFLGVTALAQQGKNAAVTGRYEGIAKNAAGEVIAVTFELTEKEGSVSGVIHSSHGDFTITSGTRKADIVTLEFDTGGPVGTISAKMSEDKLSGTWSAGDDGGSVEVKRTAAQEAPKEKS